VFLDGEYLRLEPSGKAPLTLIPHRCSARPRKVHIDRVETEKPGLLLAERGKGKIAYLPWDIGGLYYRLSSLSHAGLVGGRDRSSAAQRRQLKIECASAGRNDADESTKRNRTIVHLVNLSGHSGTAIFSRCPCATSKCRWKANFSEAHSRRLNRTLPLSAAGAYTKFSLPQLEAYRRRRARSIEDQNGNNCFRSSCDGWRPYSQISNACA
jgi:hypothetical protein